MLRPLLAAASGSYGFFYTLLVLHVAAALTGFASIGFAGTYAGRATHEASSAAPAGVTTEELVRYFRRPAGLWWALLAVPWLGLGALAAEPHGGGVAQAWDLGAFGLWVAAALVAALVVVPALGRVGAALVAPGAGPPAAGPAGLDGAARARVARSGLVASRGAMVCDVLFFMALALMIWQP
jgi:hypothetical protein